ncbi:MAG: aroE [Clostridia bacterium]|jgi:shikimate dehydrogenase|nr:aroE [Clostridia bacterium]
MKVFGLIGEKLQHSLSPAIHDNLYQLLDLNATYSLYQVKPLLLQKAIQGIQALDIKGVNVTIPYKVKVMEYLDQISPEAKKIGAVNTILNDGGSLTGFNTDYIGFGRLLTKYHIETKGETAVILGSGGAARSVAAYLEDMGISDLYIVARDPAGVHGFEKHHVITYDQLAHINQGSLLVNCTPVGMYPDVAAAPLNIAQTTKFNAVVDLIYNPFCTQLMQQAIDSGIPAYNGLYMLVAQAVAAVEIWNGISISDATVDVLYSKLLQHMKK